MKSARNKKRIGDKGFLIIEAAIVFPIIIFSAVLVLFLAINYYVDLSYNIKMQEETNKYVDEKTGNIKTKIEKSTVSKYSDKVFNKRFSPREINNSAKTSKNRSYILPAYFGLHERNEDTARTYLIDEGG